MGSIVLVTGGCRSGKSAHALGWARSMPGYHAYVATCPVVDEEMAARIEAHRRAREDQGWTTIEEPFDLAGVFRSHPAFDVFLVDCITLWVNNLMYRAEQAGSMLTEEGVTAACDDMLDAAVAHPATTVFVTNEVGMGIVPDNAGARRYRDFVGRVNQQIAAKAAAITLVVAGVAVPLKPNCRFTPGDSL